MVCFRTRVARRITALSLASSLACSGGAPPSQTVAPVRVPPSQPVRDASGAILTKPVTLREGTEFSVQTLDFISSESAVEGDPVNMETENPVIVDDAIAIGAGARVKGVISSVRHASRMGKAGSVSIRLESAESVDGQRVRLRATKTQSTDDKVGSVVALTILVTPLFLLKKGNDVAYQPGTRVVAYVDEDAKINAWKR